MLQIDAWLKALGLERYAEVFADNDIDAAMLPMLGDEDLKELGVRSLGHRKRLLAAIAELGRPASVSSPAIPLPGASVSSSAIPIAIPLPELAERRTVTVLFCDISAFTRLSRERDPEEIHGLLNRYFAAVDNLVAVHGGRVDKHIGDAVIAVFGAPVAHTNDPERAVRTAFAIHRAVATLEPPLHVHIGVASGPVVASRIGSRAHDEYTVTGAAMSQASRLQDLAGPGQTLVSEPVYQAVAPWVEATEVSQAGEDLRVWQLDRLRAEAAATSRKAPFVGRLAELARLTALYDQCAARRSGHVVHVRGEAGIGKTRLCEELRAAVTLSGAACHTAAILGFGDGEGQSAIADLACSLVGLGRSASPLERAAAAQEAVDSGLLPRQRDVFLYELLGAPQPSAQRARYEAVPHAVRAQGMRQTLVELVTWRALAQPQMLLIEDVHLADRELMAYIHELVRRIAALPVLLVTTSRLKSEPLALMPATGADAGVALTILELGPLEPGEALALATSLSQAAGALAAPLSSPMAQSCVERAGGNPLFLEQLVHSAQSLGADALPDSLHSIILARIDHLAPEDKQALQTASVMGQRFSLAALRFLLDEPGYACTALVEQRLVQPVPGSRSLKDDSADDSEYEFLHALVREGVYSSLLRSRRRALHQRAALWFGERSLAVRAEHLDRAEDPSAARAYFEAARREVETYRFERALLLIERSLKLSRARDPATEYAATSLQGEILRKLALVEASLGSFERALSLAADDIERCRAWIGMASSLRIIDRTDAALAALDRAQAVAAAHALETELANIHLLRGNLVFPRGQHERCAAENEAARQLARAIGSAKLEAKALSGLGDAAYLSGRMRTALDYFDRCLSLCRHHGFTSVEVANLPMRALARLYHTDVHGALADAETAAQTAALISHRRAEVLARGACLAPILIELGRLDDAERELEAALDLARALGARRFEAMSLGFLGWVQSLRGRTDLARPLLHDSLARCRELGDSMILPWLLVLVAQVQDNGAAVAQSLAAAEAALAAGAPLQSALSTHYLAIDVCLSRGNAAGAEHHAAALGAVVRTEPVPWAELMAQRGQALARVLRGERSADLARQLAMLAESCQAAGLQLAGYQLRAAVEGRPMYLGW